MRWDDDLEVSELRWSSTLAHSNGEDGREKQICIWLSLTQERCLLSWTFRLACICVRVCISVHLLVYSLVSNLELLKPVSGNLARMLYFVHHCSSWSSYFEKNYRFTHTNELKICMLHILGPPNLHFLPNCVKSKRVFYSGSVTAISPVQIWTYYC